MGILVTAVITSALVVSQRASAASDIDRAGLSAVRQLEVLALPAAQITDAMASYVRAEDGELDPTTTEAFMAGLVSPSSTVRSVVLAPDNTISYIVPLAGNEDAIGLDLESVPEQWVTIAPLIDKKAPGLIGPFDLVQGGSALAYRLPVFLDDGRYWGLATTIIDSDEYFAAALSNTSLAQGIAALRNLAAADDAQLIWGDPSAFDINATGFAVEPPGASWELLLDKPQGVQPLAIAVGLLGTLASIVLAALTYGVIRARQRRNEADQRLRRLAELAPGMLFQYRIGVNGESSLPYVSDRLAKTLQIDPGAMSQDAATAWDLIAEEDRARTEEALGAAIALEQPWEHRFRIRATDGPYQWFQVRAAPERLPNGDILMHGYLANVSADVAAEERVNIHASVYSATHNGVVIFSADGEAIDANDAFTHMTGYSLEEITGHHLRFLGSGLTPDAVYQDIDESLARNGSWRGQFTMRHADGEPVNHAMTLLSVRDSLNAVGHMIAVINPARELEDDIVTGLPGRLAFGTQLDVIIDLARQESNDLTLMAVGLDRFSDINTAYGQHLGDVVLRETALRLAGLLPEGTALARIGGDEFCAAIPSANGKDARHLGEQAIETLAQPMDIGSATVNPSTSIGLAHFPSDGLQGSELMNAATLALRAAKQRGGGTCVTFTAQMREAAERRSQIKDALDRVLDQGSLIFHYQPIVDLETGRVIKAEALARVVDPELGSVPPSIFIPIAEETGRIRDLGDAAFRDALRFIKEARAKVEDFGVGINLSPTELRSSLDDHRDRMMLMNDLDLPGSAIIVEITEEAALENDADTRATLAAYTDFGVRVAVDDFGTGYSSLSYLQQLPLDFLKIDRAFVASLAPGNDSHTLVTVMIEMAHTLGLRTIAEGIETVEQAELLRSAGCNFGQGYLFGAAMPAQDLLRILDQQAGDSSLRR